MRDWSFVTVINTIILNFYMQQLKSNVKLFTEGLSVCQLVSCTSCRVMCCTGLQFNFVSVFFPSQAVAAASTGRRLCVKLVRHQLCSHLLRCLRGLPPTRLLSPHPAFQTSTFPVSSASTHTLHLCPEGPFGGRFHPPRCQKGRLASCRLSNREAFFSAVCLKPFSKWASVVFQQVCNIIHVMLQLILRFKCLYICYHDGRLYRFFFFFFKQTPSNT